MAVSFLIDKDYVPNDGSIERLSNFQSQYPNASVLVFPDIHYKEGARVVNGMLTHHSDRIIPEMLGVENCGFLFGSFSNTTLTEASLMQAAKKWSLQVKDYSSKAVISEGHALELLFEYFKNHRSEYSSVRKILDLTNDDDFERKIKILLKNRYLAQALKRGIGTLGGGNHFFEFMKDKRNVYFFAIHSDSVLFGERVNNICSNLNEIAHNKIFVRMVKSFRIRLSQTLMLLRYVRTLEDLKDFHKLCYSTSGDRSVKCSSRIGRRILLLYMVANAVGGINRLRLLEVFLKSSETISGRKPVVNIISNLAHDKLEVLENGDVIQRNGVQKVHNELFYLPGALGTSAYLMRGKGNELAYKSCNHGVGRLVPKTKVTSDMSEDFSISVLRVGSSELGLQKANYFKDVKEVTKQMEKYGTAQVVSELSPFLSIKG